MYDAAIMQAAQVTHAATHDGRQRGRRLVPPRRHRRRHGCLPHRRNRENRPQGLLRLPVRRGQDRHRRHRARLRGPRPRRRLRRREGVQLRPLVTTGHGWNHEPSECRGRPGGCPDGRDADGTLSPYGTVAGGRISGRRACPQRPVAAEGPPAPPLHRQHAAADAQGPGREARHPAPESLREHHLLRLTPDERGWFRFQRLYDAARPVRARRGRHAPHRARGRGGRRRRGLPLAGDAGRPDVVRRRSSAA